MNPDKDWGAHLEVHVAIADQVAQCLDALPHPRRLYRLAIALEQDLTRHIRYEEHQVLGLYRERVADPPVNATAAHYTRDHDILKRRARRLVELALQASCKPLDVTVLGEALTTLHDTLEHHDERESASLYPALARALTAEERRALCDALTPTYPRTAREVADAVDAADGHVELDALHTVYRTFVRDGVMAAMVPEPTLRGVAALLAKASRVAQGPADDAHARIRRRAHADQALRAVIHYATRCVLGGPNAASLARKE